MTVTKKDNIIDNNTIYFTRLHRVIFFWPLVSLCFAFAIYIYIDQLRQASMFLALFCLLWIAMTWVTYYFSSITIKRKQVILRTGLIVRQTVDIPLSKIETIDIRQSILGSLMRYGALVITGTGGTRHLINYIDRPLTCRRYIEQMMNEQPH
ncbi:membrane protein [Legionella antarctica]|uniref:Membrane protein n=1 Tax=Legionella antarctica TaxID=2708020 RepID=A0A6F8T0Q6_9GAMM|nr:PH domain-containing protein [Legionella antarctica]BCA94264.1 membrane protein [Legionella antarctica]